MIHRLLSTLICRWRDHRWPLDGEEILGFYVIKCRVCKLSLSTYPAARVQSEGADD